jgi:hypothetical protein
VSDWDQPGLFEELLTARVVRQLRSLSDGLVEDLQPLTNAEAADRLSRHLASVVARLIEGHPEDRRAAAGLALVRSTVELLVGLVPARAARGELPSAWLGRRLVVPRRALEDRSPVWSNGQPDASSSQPPVAARALGSLLCSGMQGSPSAPDLVHEAKRSQVAQVGSG